ncbi:MAG: 1-deoxy-D-xylulose-5-phosphate synthase [Bacteroidia bacterium]|nr:1-deoxy-D-xylulose-5-phosphate synthase [Bacteroidia bacterium]
MSEMLDHIDSPADLRKLEELQLPALCAEIRAYMVDCCSRNPGHLASSLGAVEIITALHYVYDTPYDKIVFDVGHQAYAHKILTGRRAQFAQMRTRGGISGFPRIDESPFDAFGTGHSSTSISAALGLAEAARHRCEHRKVVAVIGDGALTGGLAFEGLNNAGDSDADLLVILNDNNRSIDENLGALHKYLLKITTHPTYNRVKDRIWHRMGESGFRKAVQRWARGFKSYLVKDSGGDLFESLGFRYFGPVDGNDIAEMTRVLRKLQDIGGPRILHCITTKGKGYAPAEADPTVWHAPGRFDPETGERIGRRAGASRYQDVFGQTLVDLARADERVVGITPAMASGSGMSLLAQQMSGRFFDVGIEEEHAVTFSAGLAAGGLRPFCNIYSSFSQRAYDQIIHDVALQGLPVVLCFDRAGVVGEDGPTHHGSFDLAAYRSVPGVVIAAPKDELELRNLMYTALRQESPFIIRYPRGCGEGVPWRECAFEQLPVGRGECLLRGERVALLALGPVVSSALQAAARGQASLGFSPSIYNIRYIKPLDADLLQEAASRHEVLLTLEDGCVAGGLFGAVSEFVASRGLGNRVVPAGIPDRFITQGSRDEELAECGLDVGGILGKIGDVLEKD